MDWSSFESDAMGFVSWRLVGMLRLHSQRHARALDEPYEPWVYMAIDRFEREIEAFYRRSGFSIVT
ncbi:hypothetical protein [Rhizobium sp. ICMP 5592]|uniref:hypothetical protein n=1 Tax=Rhizobium sp. ICMP 5592 TaxID=2292445 RepID=UPI001296EFDA|nr:hypothetical protein [Rhizobium sp. ICMP 5592]MQB45856.1 hypothetical protein [Rhizobium sp. ICMP 5592]